MEPWRVNRASFAYMRFSIYFIFFVRGVAFDATNKDADFIYRFNEGNIIFKYFFSRSLSSEPSATRWILIQFITYIWSFPSNSQNELREILKALRARGFYLLIEHTHPHTVCSVMMWKNIVDYWLVISDYALHVVNIQMSDQDTYSL